MFIVDDIMVSPFRGLLWVFEEICNAAEQELLGEADAITDELRHLYSQLEAGQITDAEFELRETELLDRLDAIQERDSDGGSEYDSEDPEDLD